ncbi:hypothetical protein FGRMN_10388 [Fusarium graminum]|nr:hypothetical protein FGRMN_10388 [Fusarium graminum]
MASPQPQPNVVRHANTTPSQPLTHQRSVARKPVGRPGQPMSSPQSISLPHRPAPPPPQQQQQQQQQAGHPSYNQQQPVQQQRPHSFHPGQQFQSLQQQQSPQQMHQAQSIGLPAQSVQTIQHQQAQPIQYPQQQSRPQHNPSQQQVQSQPPYQQQQQTIQQPYQQQQQQTVAQQHAQAQQPQQQPQPQSFNPPSSVSPAQQTTLPNTQQTQPPTASPATQLHRVNTGISNINSFVSDTGRPASISSSSAGIATPATTVASPNVGAPRWESDAIPQTVQHTPAVDVRRTSTGQPQICNHCRKGIPLNVSVYTCLVCSTAHITTIFCVWCFTSNAVNASHSHDKSYYVTESDPRVQSPGQDPIAHMWTIRKNVSGRLWYTHNTTGLKTHLKPTTAALSGFSGLPPGWVEQKTPNGQIFYFNKRTGASSWTKPANSLPDGWRELRTPDLVPFYINEQLGLSAWDRPGQQPRQQKNPSKVIMRRARPGQPNAPQNVGDNILSATINAARLTGQGVEMASRQVGKLGKKKNWRKMGRMLNQVNTISGDGSGSDGEYNDYNEDGGFGFGGDDLGGYQDQQQGQFQQTFDYQQPQQSFTFEDNQQSSMFQQTPDEQVTFEFTTQYEQPTYEQSFGQQSFEQQPEQFSVTTEISYTTTDTQPYEQQESFEYQQVYEQPGNEIQQSTFEQAPNEEPVTVQQIETFEPVTPSGSEQPVQQDQALQAVYEVPPQQAYSTQQYTYEPAQVPQIPQQSVTVSYQVPSYVTEPAPAPLFTPAQGPVYPMFMPNNQPEIITSDVPLVEVPGEPDNTNLFLGGGYDSNDILAGTSLAADNNAVISQINPVAPQDSVVVEVTIQPSPTPGFEDVSTSTPVVVQEYDTSAKPASFVTVETVQPEIDFKTGERCNALI